MLAASLGLFLLFSEIGRPLERLSYDLPFALRRSITTDPVVIVAIDETSAHALNQPLDRPWDRRIYAQLLRRLSQEGARLVCFDLIFSEPGPEAEVDGEFARAMAEHGGVILGGDYVSNTQFDVHIATIAKPTPVLRTAMAGWGLLALKPIDPDGAVRELCLQVDNIPTLSAAAAAVFLQKNVSYLTTAAPKPWLSYYGAVSEAFSTVAISDALRPNGVPPNFFRDRVVFIGGRYSTGSLTTAKDVFGNPYSRWGRQFSPGVEIHATAFLNLLRREWLERLNLAKEALIVALFGLVVGAFLCFLRPHWALIVAVGLAVGCVVIACAVAWYQLVWFPWAIPTLVQLPLGLAWSVGAQYFVEQRRRSALRRAFAYYLSPAMADRIAESNFDLRPGGSAVEATVLFTDLENFTTLSESLPVEDVSRVLIAYFTETTQHILANKGTIIKYIGDAVMATWNAPLEDSHHAQLAVTAAWALAQASNREIGGYKLRTRIGIHTGRALAGNLGSPFRFDYTVIGDTTNFASRLEGLNKYLGTQILLSEATAKGLTENLVIRPLGKFVLKGKTIPIALFELLGPKTTEWEVAYGQFGWYSEFCKGIDAFQRGDLEESASRMAQTVKLRGGMDGPAEFYLRQIEKAKGDGSCDGLVRMDEK